MRPQNEIFLKKSAYKSKFLQPVRLLKKFLNVWDFEFFFSNAPEIKSTFEPDRNRQISNWTFSIVSNFVITSFAVCQIFIQIFE